MTPSSDLSRVRAPVAEARGLPNEHYTDPHVFAEERDALLFGQWAGLAVAADVPEPGDARPLDFLGMPLLLLRDKAGQVRVFQNICRHRGMILVDAPRRIEGGDLLPLPFLVPCDHGRSCGHAACGRSGAEHPRRDPPRRTGADRDPHPCMALDAALLHAHAAGDRAALIGLRTEAAGRVPDPDAAAFFLTQAYVFALETGASQARALHARLMAAGRES
tara:strand:+ start:5733 stop:6389 length:657 start_codon:yes stop_codon:yes gene_type:complete